MGEALAPLTVRPLSSQTLADYLEFFDHRAFRDNPVWQRCYCYFYHTDCGDEEWVQRTSAQNRSAFCARVDHGQAHGYLGYADGRVVAWVNSAPREWYPRLSNNPLQPGDDPQRVGLITCFIIDADYRRRGYARLLLNAALAGLSGKGMLVAEAYPRRTPGNDGDAYHGPLSLYKQVGFHVVADDGEWLTMRKSLVDR